MVEHQQAMVKATVFTYSCLSGCVDVIPNIAYKDPEIWSLPTFAMTVADDLKSKPNR